MIKIRDYQKNDVPLIAKKQASLNLFHGLINKEYYAPSKKSTLEFTRYITKRMEDGDFKILVAEQDQACIGYALGWIKLRPSLYKKRKTGYLSHIFVDEEFRGLGIGRKLYLQMEKWFRKKRVDYVEVRAHVANKGAIQRFRSYGFKDLSLTLTRELKTK